jgi:alpha-mannosidase
VLTLSLVRGTMSPDRGADIGEHRFRYALYPHEGDWRGAGTVAEAARFNRPLTWMTGSPHDILKAPLAASSNGAVIIDTIKPAEDGKGWIVRLYESTGGAARTRLAFGVPVREAFRSNTLEDSLDALPLGDGGLDLELRPFQFMTLLLK